ncbi:hypothetical protein KSS87_007611 [Heliosperma pusillum]|nr:hypothetical protein KSS87_007611 [Heliosperma pusillum]
MFMICCKLGRSSSCWKSECILYGSVMKNITSTLQFSYCILCF